MTSNAGDTAQSAATIVCSKCGQAKPVTDFDVRFISKATRKNCATCRREAVARAEERWRAAVAASDAAAPESPVLAARRAEREALRALNTCEERDATRARQRPQGENQRQAAQHGPQASLRLRPWMRTEGRPSDPAMRNAVWLWALREGGDYPEHTGRVGKWMVFLPAGRIDAEWERVKEALHAGRLGRKAKVSTTPSQTSRDSGQPVHVIIVYTYDGDDTADVWRVRRELRAMGYTWPMGWKADTETRQGHYHATHGRVSRYWG